LYDNSLFKQTIPLNVSTTSPEADETIIVTPSALAGTTDFTAKFLREGIARYEFSGADFRKVFEIDTTIPNGISGSPAWRKEDLIGIVFQTKTEKEKKTHIIPGKIIDHFIKDTEDGNYDGFPEPGFLFQNGSHSTAKKFFGIPADKEGIFVTSIYPFSAFSKTLQEKDFIFSLDSYPFDNKGDVNAMFTESIDEYIGKKSVNEEIKIGYYRNGEIRYSNIKLKGNSASAFYRQSVNYPIPCGEFELSPITKGIAETGVLEPGSSGDYHYRYFFQDKLYLNSDRDMIVTKISPELMNIWKQYLGKIVESVNGVSPDSFSGFQKLCVFPGKKQMVIKFRGSNLPVISGKK